MIPEAVYSIDSEHKKEISGRYDRFVENVDTLNAKEGDVEKAVLRLTDHALEKFSADNPDFRGYSSTEGMDVHTVYREILSKAGWSHRNSEELNTLTRAGLWSMVPVIGIFGALANLGKLGYGLVEERVRNRPSRDFGKYIDSAKWFYNRYCEIADGA